MSDERGEREVGDLMPDDATHAAAAARAQIEQRLQDLFRFAGHGEADRQLLRMVIEYRWRQIQ